MITSIDFAEITGLKHADVVEHIASYKNLMEAREKEYFGTSDGFRLTSESAVNTNNIEVVYYKFSSNGCMLLATHYSQPIRKKILAFLTQTKTI